MAGQTRRQSAPLRSFEEHTARVAQLRAEVARLTATGVETHEIIASVEALHAAEAEPHAGPVESPSAESSSIADATGAATPTE